MSEPIPAELAPLLESHSDEVTGVFLALRALVHDVMPGAQEALDLPDRVLAFGYGPPGGVRMRGLAVGLIPHTAHVNVQLADGGRPARPGGDRRGHRQAHPAREVPRPRRGRTASAARPHRGPGGAQASLRLTERRAISGSPAS